MIKIGTSALNQQRISALGVEIGMVCVGGNLVWSKPVAIHIGDHYQDGIVFYIFQSADYGYVSGEIHGLIVCEWDVDPDNAGEPWSITNTNLTLWASEGRGLANTNTIVADQGAGNYAANECLYLNSGSYSDWYLPSYEDLLQIYAQRALIPDLIANSIYWSSNQGGSDNGAGVDFTDGSYAYPLKSTNQHVRPIRSF